MTSFLLRSGVFTLSVRYLWQKRRNGVWYYRRRYPKEIRDISYNKGHPLPQFRVVSLRTHDRLQAAKRVALLAREDDRNWWLLRNSLEPEGIKGAAESLLREYGLLPTSLSEQLGDESEVNSELFFDQLEAKYPGQRQADLSFLSSTEKVAVQILKGEYRHRLSDAKRLYLTHKKEDRKIRNAVDAAFSLVVDCIGDMEITLCRRKDVQAVVSAGLSHGLKTTTIKRRLSIVRAAVNELIKHEELSISNAFSSFTIQGLGEDSDERSCLTMEQMSRLREYVRSTDSDTSNMIGILLDTGARVAEIAGLMMADVHLEASIPYIEIHKNSLRRLKTKDSLRKIPLVGEALLAARRAKQIAGEGPLFKRYFSGKTLKNDAASAAMRKVMHRLECETPHWLRHTMRTRLRNADIPESRINEIGGWARISISETYGVQTALNLLSEDLTKSLHVDF